MKLSIGLFAAASAVGTDDPAFETPSPLCDDYVALSENYVNCWSPSGHFSSFHVENATQPSWEQTNSGGECGFQYIDTGLSLVNKTCVFNPAFSSNYDVGNAVFVAKGKDDGSIVGFDITGDFNYVQKWDVTFDWSDEFNYEINAYVDAVNAANKANTTLPEPFTFDKTYDCVAEISNFVAPNDSGNPDFDNCKDSNDDGSAYGDYAIMITNQHAEDKNNNYAIANYGGEDNTFTINIDGSCNDYGFTAHDSNQVTMVKLDTAPADKCIYQVTVKNPAAQLFYFQGSIDEGVIDFINGIDIQQA